MFEDSKLCLDLLNIQGTTRHPDPGAVCGFCKAKISAFRIPVYNMRIAHFVNSGCAYWLQQYAHIVYNDMRIGKEKYAHIVYNQYAHIVNKSVVKYAHIVNKSVIKYAHIVNKSTVGTL
jgi:hypothetical protein